MALEQYKKKRKLTKTPEPKGKAVKRGEFKFVVHEHHASHLHYDLRLELPENSPKKSGDPKEGTGLWVLKSWAVPKGPPEEPKVRRLAVEVEDHPVEYRTFEGEIPEGEYGAGTVKIWDKGNFDLIERTPERIEFILKGRKLQGFYILLRFKKAGERDWLLLKGK